MPTSRVLDLETVDYFEPKSVSEAVSVLLRYGERATIVAGGTDVMVDLKYREEPQCLINIKRIPNMSYIREDKDCLRIGALTPIREIEISEQVREKFPILWGASNQFASIQIRNMATIGGNICRASPAGEMLAPLLVLEARANVIFPEGEKIIPLNSFFVGPSKTSLGTKGLLKEIEIPYPPAGNCGLYLKHAVRGAMDIALVGVAILIAPDSAGMIASEVRIGLAAVAPTPMRARKAENMLQGKVFHQEGLGAVAKQAAEEARPITDHRATADYRRWIVEALVRRGLTTAWQDGRKEESHD